jgi:hypothetical protein
MARHQGYADDMADYDSNISSTGDVTQADPDGNMNEVPLFTHVVQQHNTGFSGGTDSSDATLANPPSQ